PPVQTARYLIRDYQKWTIVPAGSGFYKILGVAAGEALEATTNSAATLSPFTGADSQLWKIDQFQDGSYRIASKPGNLALTVPPRNNPGNTVTLEPFSGDDAQRWTIVAP